MEQQTIRIGQAQLPPLYPNTELLRFERGRKGGPKGSADVFRRPTGERVVGPNPAGVVRWVSRLGGRPTGQDAPLLPDLDRALVNPASVFDTPQDVVRHPLLTIDCKREILGRWAWDEYLLELADTEGMPGVGPSRLDEVKAALRLVTKERSPDPAAPAAFVVPYRRDEHALAA